MRPILAALYFLYSATAQSFNYRDFSEHRDLGLQGTAHYNGKVLRLTDARLQTSAAAWYPVKLPVASGFDTEFQFHLTEQGGLGNGADGFAFVLQTSGPSSLAGRGSAGGWGFGDGQHDKRSQGIPRAIAIFFDTHRNPEDHDPSDNYIGIFNNGRPGKMHWPAHRLAFTPYLRVRLKDGRPHTARILYRPPIVSIYLDDPSQPVLVSPVDLGLAADQAGMAWVGFTASTGAGFENHDILSWSFHQADVSSAMVSSNISFFMDTCLPGRNLCTPDRAIIDQIQPGRFHIVLPANLKWGASIPNPTGREPIIDNPRGTVCWNLKSLGPAGCRGPSLDPAKPGSLILKTANGRTSFSVNDTNFDDNEGYFEFEVELR